MSTTEAIGPGSAFIVATQENIHQLQLFREDLVQRHGLSRFVHPNALERTEAREEHVDPSARPENTGPKWIGIDAFKASDWRRIPDLWQRLGKSVI